MNALMRGLIASVIVLAQPISNANAATYLFHNDHLGTPQVLTDSDQQVVWQSAQDPFGEVTEVTNQVEQNLRFPGQYFDIETGLNYNYYRSYNPETGRYTQSDPIGLFGGVNTYGYAMQNPMSFSDPLGLFSCSCKSVSKNGGNGSTINGRKQFNYSCTCACDSGSSNSFIISGGSQGNDSDGQTGLGAILVTRPATNGQLYTDAVGFNHFDVESNPSWYNFWSDGESTLNENINSVMEEFCKDDDDAMGCEE